MSFIAILDFLSVAGFLVAFLILQWQRELFQRKSIKRLLSGLFLLNAIYCLCMAIQWSGISTVLERLEDVTGALVPMGWAFVIYAIIQAVQRKDAEKSIRASQQKILMHVRQTPLAVIEWNLDFEVAEWNLAAEKIFGFSRSEVIGQRAMEMIVPDMERSKASKVWESLLKQQGGERSTGKNITSQGKIIYCEWYNTPLVDDGGNIIGVASLAQDITRRVQTEKELRLTKYSIDNSSTAAFWIRQDGRIHYVNKAGCYLTGYPLYNLLNVYVWDIDPRLSREVFGKLWQKLEEKNTLTFEDVFKNRDGRQIPVEINTNLHDFEGEKYLFSYVLEITERKKSEMELTRLASAIEQSTDNIIITDPAGNIEYVNPSFERVTGYQKSEVLGNNPRILKSGQHDKPYYENLWQTISQGKIWTGTFTNRCKSGKLIEESATICPVVDSTGEIKNFIGIKRDITEQNKLERQLRQVQKLEAIGTLASGIAHDFNNILGAIFGYTQLLKRKLKNLPEQEKVEGLIDKMFSAGSRAKELIDQILMFSRKGDFDPQIIDLVPLVKESVKFLRATIPTTIDIKLNIDPHLKKLNGDTTQIQQVIINLCTNASQAMEEKGGTLEITLGNYTIKEHKPLSNKLEPGDYLLLTVNDSGVGMKEEIKQRIFEPFFTTKEKGKGTGLGLSVVHGIVTKHGGAVNVYSREGFGTKFSVYLPASLEETAQPKNRTDQELPTGSESILFVDDERDLCYIFGQILEEQGYQVQTSQSSSQALNFFQKNPEDYDLVITDYTMPEMNGIDLGRKIHHCKNSVPIILISGLGQIIPDEDLKAAGIVAKYSKPIDFAELLIAIREILNARVLTT